MDRQIHVREDAAVRVVARTRWHSGPGLLEQVLFCSLNVRALSEPLARSCAGSNHGYGAKDLRRGPLPLQDLRSAVLGGHNRATVP